MRIFNQSDPYLKWIALLTFVVKIWGIFQSSMPDAPPSAWYFPKMSISALVCPWLALQRDSSANLLLIPFFPQKIAKKITLKRWHYISLVTNVFFIFFRMNGRDICPRRDGRWWTVWDISQETLNICVSPPRKREYCPGGQNKCSTKTFCRGNLFLSIILFGQTLHGSRETQHNE